MVARGGIEPPTRGFSGDSRGLLSNHLQRLPAPSPASPRHNYGTPNLSSSHSRHSGVCCLIPFSAPNNQRDQTIKLGNEDIFANASLRARRADISGIRSPRLCFGCAWQAGGLRVEGGRQAAAKLAVVSHDQAVGKSALAILPVEKCLLHCSLVLER